MSDRAPPPAPNPGTKKATDQDVPPAESRGNYIDALLAEIRILVRAIANDPTKHVSDIRVKWQDDGGALKDYSYPAVVAAIAELSTATATADQLKRIGLLQAIKDQLITLTSPATGLSIAYTSLVIGNQRGSDIESTNVLAKQAYGSLERGARRHRLLISILGLIALLLSIFAAWEATKASLGKSLLQVLEPLRAQQVLVNADKFKLEMTLDKGEGASVSGSTGTSAGGSALLPICERYILTDAAGMGAPQADLVRQNGIHLHGSPQIREVCSRDEILARSFEVAHYGLQKYLYFWPDVAGGLYAVVGRVLGGVRTALELNAAPNRYNTPEPRSCGAGGAARDSGALAKALADLTSCGDVEFLVAPVVQVISNYTLPFIFGVIGSLLYVILQHYSSVRTNTLHPRDKPLAYLRVILGIVVAACVSLLITSYAGTPIQPPPGSGFASGSLAGSLTLSASGLTFLAGFGAEAVFTLLQGLVERVFALPK